jgi:DNA repair protein SbcC/Rad50
MRPIRLEIEGLTSFRERQEIDFDGLDLFAITGPTGAGKTTILDAMTLALYGEVPRTGKRNTAELITHGDTRARVWFEFRADGKTYRVARVLPRNGAQRATLERRDGDDWLPEVEESGVRPINARIEGIIGLDFDGFTRAVLLPQGEFAKFLSGDARQRREILVRLLELGRYEKAGHLARQEADKLDSDISAKSQLLAEDFGDATKEGVSAAAEAATDAKARADLIAKAGEKVDQLMSHLTELGNQLTSIQTSTTALGGVLEVLDTVAKEWTKLHPQEAETGAALLSARTNLGESKTAHGKAAVILETVLARNGDEALLATLDSACATTARETNALVHLAKAVSAAEQDIDRLAGTLAAAAEDLEKAKARHSGVRVAEDQAREQVDQFGGVVRQARERADVEKEVARLTAESRRWRDQFEIRSAALRELEAATLVAEDRVTHLQAEHAAIGIRTRLTVGEPCPVCLQLVQQTPSSSSDIVNSIAAAESDARAARQRLRKAQEAVAEANGEVRAGDRSLANAREVLDRVGRAPLLAQAETEAAALKAKLAKAVGDREAVTRLVNKATEDHGKVAADLASAKTERESRQRERVAAESRRRTAEGQLKKGFPAGIPGDPAGAIAERRGQLEAARESEAVARKNFDRARETHDEAAAARANFERKGSELIQRCAEQRGVLGQLSLISGIDPTTASMKKSRQAVGDEVAALGEWRELVARALDRQRNAAQKEQKNQTEALSQQLTAMGLSFTTLGPSKVQTAARKSVQDASLAATRTADHAASLERKLARRQEIESQITEAREREHLYRALADELRQNRFIDYLLGESIGGLARLASSELRSISSGRYGLIAEQSGFAVVDHANADETRSVDTLSGGETFLASLSLATALARSITDIAGEAIGSRLEAMFIDEGFGALDAESLDAAIDALERFRESGRLIGVITHVSELAERIPDGLVVERKGASSHIRRR